jgi:hypothetical protein
MRVDGPVDAQVNAHRDAAFDVPMCSKYSPTVGYCAGENNCPAGAACTCAADSNYCCIPGFCWTRYIASCTQEQCPASAGRDYTNHCKCPTGTTAVYDSCRPGLVTACSPS